MIIGLIIFAVGILLILVGFILNYLCEEILENKNKAISVMSDIFLIILVIGVISLFVGMIIMLVSTIILMFGYI